MSELKPKALRQETLERLRSLLEEKRRALGASRALAMVGKLKNAKEIRRARKEVARILTVIRERSRL